MQVPFQFAPHAPHRTGIEEEARATAVVAEEGRLHGADLSATTVLRQRSNCDQLDKQRLWSVIGNLSRDQLRVLVTIVDTGSFSAAGRKLGRAQSAISLAVAALETMQDVALFDRSGYKPRLTEIGRVLVDHARLVLASAARFEAVAAGTRQGLEPELTLAIDPLVPTAPLIDSLRTLRGTFPDLPVSFSTEGLGGSLRRLRDGSAALAICLLLPNLPEDIAAYPLLRIGMRPVVAPSHPLASLGRPAKRDDLEPHVQLVLSYPVDPCGANYGLASARLWLFVDLGRRFAFLVAGFG